MLDLLTHMILLHRTPASEPLLRAWLSFSFYDNVPESLGKVGLVSVYANDEGFKKCREGLFEILSLIERSVPSDHGNDRQSKTVSFK